MCDNVLAGPTGLSPGTQLAGLSARSTLPAPLVGSRLLLANLALLVRAKDRCREPVCLAPKRGVGDPVRGSAPPSGTARNCHRTDTTPREAPTSAVEPAPVLIRAPARGPKAEGGQPHQSSPQTRMNPRSARLSVPCQLDLREWPGNVRRMPGFPGRPREAKNRPETL